jgi:hypothetical protein
MVEVMNNNRAWVSTRKGLFEVVHLTGSENRWSVGRIDFLGEPVTATLHDARDGTMYAALNLGHFGVKLHRRDAGSETWDEVNVPMYPPQPDGAKEQLAWKLSLIWTLVAGGNDEPGVIWAGTMPGGLFRSRDRGDSWELIRALWDAPGREEWFGGGFDAPGIHSICVDPRDSRHVLVGVSCGGVWVTRDGGGTWELSAKGMRADYMPPEKAEEGAGQDPHRIAQCHSAPDTLWCQHHGGIWRSVNGGALWDEIKNVPVSNFGFAVASHPNDPETAWFAPAIADQKRVPVDSALAVTLTRDGGKTFDVLRAGLPQSHCYDLVYRHGLAVANDGRTLIMGSTTGGLWGSSDAGENWQAISTTLPPIYAVSF